MANAHGFIMLQEDGYETLIGDRGMKLSGGQRQRLTIARAMLKNAPILILDEATSAIDAESEAFIKEGLRKLENRPTIIMVAHRLSTVADMDRVALIEDGRVTALGPHRELLETSDSYRELVSTQLIEE